MVTQKTTTDSARVSEHNGSITSKSKGAAYKSDFDDDHLAPPRGIGLSQTVDRTRIGTEGPSAVLMRSLRILLQQIVNKKRNYDQYLSQSQRALAALPLTTAEYGQLASNIHNVQKYLEQDETVAARFELMLLLRRLPRVLTTI